MSVHEEAAHAAAAHAEALQQAIQAAERRVQEQQAHEKMMSEWAEEQPEARVITPANGSVPNSPGGSESGEGAPPPLKVLLPLAQGLGDRRSSEESAAKEALHAVTSDLQWHKTQLADAIDRYDKLKVSSTNRLDALPESLSSWDLVLSHCFMYSVFDVIVLLLGAGAA